MRSRASRGAFAGGALALAVALLSGCATGPADPAGSGGIVGHMSGTSDVEGQPGDPAAAGGGLAFLPVAAMAGAFWEAAGEEPLEDPESWSHLAARLDEAAVSELGGDVVPIDGEGGFRVTAPPAEYAVCYCAGDIGGRITGCDTLELPPEGELEASWGEAGFHIRVAD